MMLALAPTAAWRRAMGFTPVFNAPGQFAEEIKRETALGRDREGRGIEDRVTRACAHHCVADHGPEFAGTIGQPPESCAGAMP